MSNFAYEERKTVMSTKNTDTSDQEFEVKEWLAIRKEAGPKIDPETAEVMWTYAQTLDPYGVYPNLPEEYQQVGREYFARAPESEIWVSFGDIPDEIRERLWKKHKRALAFPASLFVPLDPEHITAEEALEGARAFDVGMSVSGDTLVLTAASEPPPSFLDLLSSCKADIIILLRREEAARANDNLAGVSTPGWRKIL
jgi:hypothetical protein